MEKRNMRSYTEDFKRSSAKLAVESEQSIAATAREKRYYSNNCDIPNNKLFKINHCSTNR